MQPWGQLSSCCNLSHSLGASSSSSAPQVPWNQHRLTHGSVCQHHHSGPVSLTLTQQQHQHIETSASFSGGSQSCQSVMDCFALALPTCKSCCFAGVFFSGLCCLHPFLCPPFCFMFLEQQPTQFHQEQSSTSTTPAAPEESRQQIKPGLRDNSASQRHLEKGG